MEMTITNATVEIEIPAPLDFWEYESQPPRVKIGAMVRLKNVVIRFPEVTGKIGELGRSNENGTTVTIKTFLLRSIEGDILPEMPDDGTVVLFDVEDADTPIIASRPCPKP